jgi:polyhydroxyalkanoate synthesis repressor PhaR
MSKTPGDVNRIIKKYPNRRLYDTQTSTYITVHDVKQLVLDGEEFRVVDAKSQEDLTRAVLLQIILDEETAGKPIFSESTLSNIVRFYGHAMQGVMGAYLEKNMQAFLEIHDRMTEQQRTLFGKGKMPGDMLGAESWTQFMNAQAPVMQNMMSNYLEQSKNMFVQMQEQFEAQTANLAKGMGAGGLGAGMPGMGAGMFGGFPPGFPAPFPFAAPVAPNTDKKK